MLVDGKGRKGRGRDWQRKDGRVSRGKGLVKMMYERREKKWRWMK